MDNRFIMTAFGKDRPGIVADVTRILFDNDCNLEDTAMTMLADEFTLVLLFASKHPDIEQRLAEQCQKLAAEKGIIASVRPLQQRVEAAPGDFDTCTLHVEGVDHSGIVYRISRHLADHALNILDLKSTMKQEPGSGTVFYLMDIRVQVPRGLALEELEQGLSSVADELNVDISVAR